MSNIGDFGLGAIAATAQKNIGKEEEMYLNEEDGLLYCKNCKTPRQHRINFQELGLDFMGGEKVVHCRCKCQAEADRREKEEEEKRAKAEKAAIQNRITLRDEATRELLERSKFAYADIDTEHMDKAMQYVEQFDRFKAQNIGLMLYSPNTGNGKTFIASCIANGLMEKNRTVAMITPARLLGMEFAERSEYISRLPLYELFILDDFGVQRENSFANEQLYNLINERVKSNLPMIITTNLVPSQLREKDADITVRRIYDRINELCMPVQFTRESRRSQIRKEKWAEAAKIFGGVCGST